MNDQNNTKTEGQRGKNGGTVSVLLGVVVDGGTFILFVNECSI